MNLPAHLTSQTRSHIAKIRPLDFLVCPHTPIALREDSVVYDNIHERVNADCHIV